MGSPSTSPTSIQCIKNWQEYRKQKTTVQASLSTVNSFKLKVGSISVVCNRLHIYFGQATPAGNTGGLCFYAVPSICDYKNNIDTEYNNYVKNHEGTKKTKKDYVNTKLVPIDFLNEPFKYSVTDHPNAALLIDSIKNWNNHEIRDNWIEAQFPDNIGSVLAAFVIDISDFELFHEHTCFFALKQISKKGEPKKYVIDLVVVNTTTGVIINLVQGEDETSVSFRDMARPVPPFGQENNENNFGTFELVS